MSNKGNHDYIKSFFSSLLKGSDLIADAYNNGFIEYDFENQRTIDDLKSKRVLFTTDNGKIRLQPKLLSFINYAQEDEKSRHINTSFGDNFEDLKILCDRYLVEKNKSFIESQRIFLEIETIVYEITEGAKDASGRLRRKVNDKFGYVKAISDKKIENERAITIIEKIIDNLRIFTFDRMSEMAQGNIKLYPLLCNTLVDTLTNCYQELELTLSQLKRALISYRVLEKKNALVTGFLSYWKIHPEYEINEYSEMPIVPELFNVVTPTNLSAHADLESNRSEEDLLKIIIKTKVKEAVYLPVGELNLPEVIGTNKIQRSHIVKVDPLELATDKFMALSVREKRVVSAISFYNDNELYCDKTTWLFYLIAKLSLMSINIKRNFAIEYIRNQNSIASGTSLLKDIKICFLIK